MPDAPKPLVIAETADFSCGPGVCRISSVETSHRVAGEKVSLTSNDYFFKVILLAQLPRGGSIDLNASTLVADGDAYPIARDAQRLAGSRELTRALKPDEKVEFILYFEAPAAAIAPGLKLIVAGGDGVSLQ